MRVNFSAVIRDLDGEPVMTAKKGARVEMLREVPLKAVA